MYKLIMLPNPILVSDEQLIKGDKCFDPTTDNGVYSSVLRTDTNSYWNKNKFPKIIAGLLDLPKLDLSLIAEEIGWVDVEKLAEEAFNKRLVETNQDVNWVGYGKGVDNVRKSIWIDIWISGFEAAQSLNEKKYSEEDMIEFCQFHRDYFTQCSTEMWNTVPTVSESFKVWLSKRKPKEYQVEVEMELFNTRQSTDYTPYEKGSLIPIIKITNNTIKVTKIIN